MDPLIVAMERMLHRCAYLQMAIREGMPAHVVLVQTRSLERLLKELVPLLEERDAADLASETKIIKVEPLTETDEQALMEIMGVNNANTDPDSPTYPPQDWR